MRLAAFILLATSLPTARVAGQDAPQVENAIPVAVRHWGGATVSLEFWWYAPIWFDPANIPPHDESPADASLIVQTRQTAGEAVVNRFSGEPVDVELFNESGERRQLDIVYNRSPNDVTLKRAPATANYAASGHEIAIRTDDHEPIVLRHAGLTIVHWHELDDMALDEETHEAVVHADLLILPIDDPAPPTVAAALATAGRLAPRFILPVGAPDVDAPQAAEAIAAFVELAKQQCAILEVEHNTFALKASDEAAGQPSTVVVLKGKPWAPEGELATLLEKMDAACRQSQKVFAPLTSQQMNFRPGDGTHTPRWNAEHLLGRQLLFFSQIYAAQRPDAFEPIDLNPAQMPPDYKAAHADWTGAAEARQMQRANAYVRRFAYLLDDLPLGERAPGSRWTPRGLLEQMERHFNEHTANVLKKFELPDWPEK